MKNLGFAFVLRYLFIMATLAYSVYDYLAVHSPNNFIETSASTGFCSDVYYHQ